MTFSLRGSYAAGVVWSKLHGLPCTNFSSRRFVNSNHEPTQKWFIPYLVIIRSHTVKVVCQHTLADYHLSFHRSWVDEIKNGNSPRFHFTVTIMFNFINFIPACVIKSMSSLTLSSQNRNDVEYSYFIWYEWLSTIFYIVICFIYNITHHFYLTT